MYSFVTNWYFEAPIDKVWQKIEDVANISEWLSDFRKVKLRPQINNQDETIIDIEYRGDLPYTFLFTLKVVKVESPNLLELEATGDLIGTGKWVLQTKEKGTSVTYFWDVSVSNFFFKLLAKIPFLKAFTERNHNATMERAYQNLRKKLMES